MINCYQYGYRYYYYYNYYYYSSCCYTCPAGVLRTTDAKCGGCRINFHEFLQQGRQAEHTLWTRLQGQDLRLRDQADCLQRPVLPTGPTHVCIHGRSERHVIQLLPPHALGLETEVLKQGVGHALLLPELRRGPPFAWPCLRPAHTYSGSVSQCRAALSMRSDVFRRADDRPVQRDDQSGWHGQLARSGHHVDLAPYPGVSLNDHTKVHAGPNRRHARGRWVQVNRLAREGDGAELVDWRRLAR